MLRSLIFIVPFGFLTACALVPGKPTQKEDPAPLADAAALASEGQTRPVARPEGGARAPVPGEGARTAEQFDTTTAEQKAEAASTKPNPSGEAALGSTVASLGDPTEPGFWLETPLVDAPAKGRVHFPKTGASAQVDLRPIEGAATAGSRLSLPAMRLLGAQLTDLIEIEVFRISGT